MTELVGVINVTPDSFSDGGKYYGAEVAIAGAKQMFEDGAVIVDIGAESTRPNATALTSEEEWKRLGPVLRYLIPAYPGKISLDSYHSETVRRAYKIGPVIVNDVTGLSDPEMVKVVLELKPVVIISHLPGNDIQAAHSGEPVDSLEQVKDDLLAKAGMLIKNVYDKSKIILDPGIGFGKTMELNRELLEFAKQAPDFKVMIGYSRKRFLGEKRMEIATNLEAGKIAAASGAAYLRVHDIPEHIRVIN